MKLYYPLAHSFEKYDAAHRVLYPFLTGDNEDVKHQNIIEAAFESGDMQSVIDLANKHGGLHLIDGNPAFVARDRLGAIALASLEIFYSNRELFNPPVRPCEICGRPISYKRRKSVTCGHPCQNKLSARSLKRKAAARLRQRARRRVESGKLSDTKYQKLTVEIEKILRGEEHEAIMGLDILSKKYSLGPIEKLSPGRPKRRG